MGKITDLTNASSPAVDDYVPLCGTTNGTRKVLASTLVGGMTFTQQNSDWNATTGVAQILNKPTIPSAQIQSDWMQSTTSSLDYIKNKPSIPTQYTDALARATISSSATGLSYSSSTGAFTLTSGYTIPTATTLASFLTSISGLNISLLNNNSNYVADASYVHTDNNFTNALKSNYDTAYTNSHTHSNKTILDNTTASFTTAQETKLINTSNTNTGDQDLSGLANTSLSNITTAGNTAILNVIKNARYDSGWFAVTVGTTYTKTHGLGTANFKYTVLIADDASGTNQRTSLTAVMFGSNTYGWYPFPTNATTLAIAPLGSFVGLDSAGYGVTSAYYRIIAEAL